MKFQFGFGRTQTQRAASGGKEERSSRKSEWVQSSMQAAQGEASTGSGDVVEGGLFIRSEDGSDNQQDPASTLSCITITDSSPTLPVTIQTSGDLKKPGSKRIQNWLNFFYPLSPLKSSSIMPTVSPASSISGSDVETDPILQHFSPPPKRSILKKRMQADLMSEEAQRAPSPASSETSMASATPTLKKRTLVFAEVTCIVDTWSREDYNRSAIDYVARALTPAIALLIKKELNEVKSEMDVHEESRKHTQFYAVPGQ